MASHYNITDVLETSAKHATNVNEAFNKMALALKRKYEGSSRLKDNNETVDIGATADAEGAFCSSC